MDPLDSDAQHAIEMRKKPWKYIGYRGFTTFLDSDDNFLVFRRYGILNTRILLYLQDKIAVAEKELEDFDIHFAKRETGDVNNGSFRQEMIGERERVLDRIHVLMKEYNDLLIQYSTIRAWPTAPENNIQSVGNWLHNTKGAIHDEEAAYIKRSNDLIALAPKTKSPLRRLFERSSFFHSVKAWKKKPPQPMDIVSPYSEFVYYIDDARVESFVRVFLTVLGMVMLIAPLWILAVTHGRIPRLGVITSFIVLFLGLVAFTTTARPFESLAATAAYSAVLVVFLQIEY